MIGYNGPVIIVIISTWLFRHLQKTLVLYYIGNVVCVFINIILKNIIKDPRPDGDETTLELLHNYENQKRFDWDKYGMPSGHAQLMFYSVMFIYTSLHNLNWTLLCLALSINTIIQRYNNKNHTASQLLVGSIIGVCLGYIFCIYK